jgi:DNA-binding SARP family transcriptional activator
MVLRAALVVLAMFWTGFLVQFVRNIVRLRRGHQPGRDGSAWLAGLVVVLLPFLLASGHPPLATTSITVAAPAATTVNIPSWSLPAQFLATTPSRERVPLVLTQMSPLALTLMAKRRTDLLREHQFALGDGDVDDTVALLRAKDPQLLDELRDLIGDAQSGVVRVTNDRPVAAHSDHIEPVVVCVLDQDEGATTISFAREGGHLLVREGWNGDDVAGGVTALHEGGRLRFAANQSDLMRALATRTLHGTLVLFEGDASELDEELRACTVTVGPFDPAPSGDPSESWTTPPHARPRWPSNGDVRAELLRADPQIIGLGEPFTPTLRRRCIEMVAYLALHRREPVTGERLRTRVLTHADVDASTRTLANTASAVRRSLGIDAAGTRLHAVSSSGLYVTHGLTSDVEVFHALVGRARQLPAPEAAPLVRDALLLIQGEPLASALRGFEWFLAEGHAGRLARDAEWAALALHHGALAQGDYELAYWALEQGRLIDPYSDALIEALARVPRLREFGGDGTGRAKHQAVGSSCAVAVSGPLDRFSEQIA